MITVDGIDVGYDEIERILSHISFDVADGMFFGIIGPNGSGKTTLIKALSRTLTPQSGAIFLEEKDIASFSYRDLAREVSVVPQETNISFDFTVEDIVMMGRHPYLTRFSSETPADIEIVRHAMELTNTLRFRHRSINEISGGERQRVIIARALAQQPKILLLDEATSHLDISHEMEILSIITSLKGDVTVVAIFHDLNLAAHYCDELILLNEGRIVSIGTPAQVLTRENIRDVYGIDVLIRTNPMTGAPYVIPIVDQPVPAGGNLKIHLICGGGAGTDIMYLLHRKGYRVTTGVLCVNDSDFTTAQELDIPCVSVPPFSQVSPPALGELEKRLSDADAVLVTTMPVGPGNIDNIRILTRYPGDRIIMVEQEEVEKTSGDFTGGEADRIIAALKADGARIAGSYEELLTHLLTMKTKTKQ
ncbi:MAG: ABC transporter ATP-binding protein [Methanomicrobiaceae archaeon]|nr:ABC transporter ATP-binding protein [Methanomicrobiaceae archaeon]